MKLEIPKSLKELCLLFAQQNSPLYLVGGYVRNSLLGFVETDIDICGPLRYDKVQKMLSGTIFDAKVKNEKLGTLLIKSKVSEEEFEYTTFRKENYSRGGNHSPDDVCFITDIREDASRRDFTCNAVYYNISNNSIIDFFGGTDDTFKRVLKTVNLPEITFDDDGLRILRLARMSAELDFEIDENCYNIAKAKIEQLKDISQERFNKEILSILFADFKYDAISNPNAPLKGISVLSDFGAWGYIFRQLAFEYGIKNINEKLKEKWCYSIVSSPSFHRVSLFTYEILNALKLPINSKNINAILGQDGLMLSKKEVLLQTRILCGIEDIKTLVNDDIRIFIIKNSEIISRILSLARILGIGENIQAVYNFMKMDNAPFSVKELAISGNDIIENFPNIPRQKYGELFNAMLLRCAITPELNTKKNLFNILKGKEKC